VRLVRKVPKVCRE